MILDDDNTVCSRIREERNEYFKNICQKTFFDALHILLTSELYRRCNTRSTQEYAKQFISYHISEHIHELPLPIKSAEVICDESINTQTIIETDHLTYHIKVHIVPDIYFTIKYVV